MSAQVRGKIDRSMVQELGGLELGDLCKAGGSSQPVALGRRLERPIMEIRLEEIKGESPLQSRKVTFDPAAYAEDAELLASVQEHGVLEPVMVRRDGGSGTVGVYTLVFGHRRQAAAAMAGLVSIPAIIARGSDDPDLLTLAENGGGRQLSPYERAVALARLKKGRPELTQAALANRLGMSQGAISNLLAAYEGSSPALRGLFAEGMDARAVVELQATFDGLGEKEQVELAEKLRHASKYTVRSLNELVQAGVKPQAAAAAVGTHRSGKGNDRSLSLRGEAELQAVAEQTGASLRTVKGLAARARKAGAGLDALRLACAYVARGGMERDPIGIACELAEDRRVTRLVVGKMELERKAWACIASMSDEKQQALLKVIVFGGSHGA